MERERLLTIAVVFLFILNIAVVGFLFFRKPGPPPPPELFKVIVRELELDESQQKTFFYLRDEHRDMIDDLDRKFKDTFEVYMNLLQQENPATTVHDSLENQMALIEKSKASITLQHFQKVKELCNDEQKKKFNALVPELTRYIARPRNQRPHP